MISNHSSYKIPKNKYVNVAYNYTSNQKIQTNLVFMAKLVENYGLAILFIRVFGKL